jgi:arginyl-tRNA synthetase
LNNRIRQHIIDTIEQTLDELKQAGKLQTKELPPPSLQNTRDEQHGDLATNIAMRLSKSEKKPPMEVARTIAEALDHKISKGADFDKVEVAKPGFINFYLSFDCVMKLVQTILDEKQEYGKSDSGGGKKVNIEFVSANPTGPLTVGHGRASVIGDVLARTMNFAGYDVTREYFFNDAGNQMRVLAESVRTRYRQLLGENVELADEHYQGEYIIDIAKKIRAEHGDNLDESAQDIFKKNAEEEIFVDIRSTLESLGIVFDEYYNEHSLYETKKVWDVVEQLKKDGLAYDKEGAVWFKAGQFGGGDDRVIVKSSGDPTYRLPDIAYHIEKIKRGFDIIIDIFGADHHATVPDVMAGIKAMGHDTGKIKVLMHQFVTLTQGGKQVKMSTRKANYVTLDELIEELGSDAVRYFYNMRRMNSHLEFDLELAKKHSMDNPVFYVQYAHARICSIYKKYPEKTGKELIDFDAVSPETLELLNAPAEISLIKTLARFPRLVEEIAESAETHRLNEYIYDVATRLQKYYTDHRVISDDQPLTSARLAMVRAVQIVLQNGLGLLGINAPESM